MAVPLDSILAPYLTPDQALLLRYEGTLAPALLAELGARLRAELGVLRTFVPEPLARNPEAALRRGGAFWQGTLVCADLSGFTAVAEALTAQGRRGTEALRAMLNQVFEALLLELHSYGGTVLKFGGDALTCFFDAAALGPRHSWAAAQAALAMQRQMAVFADYPLGGRSYQLRLRVGVHTGRPFTTVVSTAGRREFVVTGRVVNRTVALQELADPGEVLISAEVAAALPSATVEARGSGQRLLAIPSLEPLPAPPLPAPPAGDDLASVAALAAAIAELRPFLPATLPSSILPLAAQTGGEFRSVSAVFINVASLSGVLALLEELERPAHELLNLYFGSVHGVVQRYGGEINKFDITSAGDKLLVIFGAPHAHEDDPLRAVEAALALGPALEVANEQLRRLLDVELNRAAGAATGGAGLWRAVDLSLRQRIGVASGTVYAGTVGSARRREYTVIGQTVNLAARLMAVAEPGAVLLAPSTARAVGEAVTLQQLPPLTLKGFHQPVAAAVAQGMARSASLLAAADTPLIGRERELASLRGAVQAALGGTGRVVAIQGEPGIGKSRLLAAFWQEFCRPSVRCITLSGRLPAQCEPYRLVRDLLTQLFALPADGNGETLWAALEQLVSSTAPVFTPLTPLLEAVFPQPDGTGASALVPGSQPLAVDQLPPPEQRERLHDLLTALIVGAAQERPLLLLIDDLHVADDSSLAVVGQLAAVVDGAPMLLLLSYRSHLLASTPWLDLSHTLDLQLHGLSNDQSRALLGQLLAGIAPEALAPLLERAQGSPAFLEAAVRQLIDQGSVVQDEQGRWQLRGPLSDAYIPEALEAVLAAQLDQLDDETRELVQVMAVIGLHSPYQLLAGVFSQTRQPARRLLELVQRGVLVAEEQEGGSGFRFRQTLLRDVAYRSILYAQRRELHRRVAQRIEQLFAAELERFAAELAYHYGQAEEYDLACAYALRAARSSSRHNALREALALYGQARELLEQHPGLLDEHDTLQVWEELADVATLAGEYDQAGELYQRLLSATAERTELHSALRTAVLARKLGGVYEQQSRFDEALQSFHLARRALERASSAPPSPAVADAADDDAEAAVLELGRICSAVGWVYFRRGDPERARQWLDEALAGLDRLSEAHKEVRAERARVYNRLGGVAWMLGDLPTARIYVGRSIADFSYLNDRVGLADGQNNLGILAEQLGDWAGAVASYQAALDLNQQMGRRRATALSRLNLGAAQLHRGVPSEALPLLASAADEARAVGDLVHETMSLRWLGRAQIQLGHFDLAESTLGRALVQAREAELMLDQLDAQTALGELALARGDQQGARAAYHSGELLWRLVEPAALEVGLFLRFAARCERAFGSAARAASLQIESERILRALGVAGSPAAPTD